MMFLVRVAHARRNNFDDVKYESSGWRGKPPSAYMLVTERLARNVATCDAQEGFLCVTINLLLLRNVTI